MSCGCNQATGQRRRSTPRPPSSSNAAPSVVAAASSVMYEVWRDGRYTGRRSTTLVSAQQIADRLGGEVRTVK